MGDGADKTGSISAEEAVIRRPGGGEKVFLKGRGTLNGIRVSIIKFSNIHQ